MGRWSRALASMALVAATVSAQGRVDADPDALYRNRDDMSSAARAADIWANQADADFDAAWKLARACYWLGTHQVGQDQRQLLERGVRAGESAVRLAGRRPEGHFWLAANMGRLAESFGFVQALKYRGRIKDELEQVLRIDPVWQGGAADDALGQWYAAVPRLFGGSRQQAEQHFRQALGHDATNKSALFALGQLLVAEGRIAEARAVLRRVIDTQSDSEWAPEDREFKDRATAVLKTIGG